ncbi:uncharacterized protein LOC116120915 isoform X2 [Pistacia vera]|uniref:uncharacterized protein LOC116120915 isoform X2 n=1 Tax=Pistacia vera TaxID=55513 RepID=UPI0012634B9A|nr:uncharacterized protein LOC116120915 isoform X2 [Pistacia vera]
MHKTMPIKPASLLCLNHNILFTGSPCITYPICPIIFHRGRASTTTSMTRIVILKCKSSGSEEIETGNNNLKDALSGLVDQQVEELLKKEENRALLDGLEKASQRVELAKRELAEIEKQELEAKQLRDYVNQLESRAFELAETQREIVEARAIIEEAERSLLLNADGIEDGNALVEKESEGVDSGVERLESITAASVSALVGSLAGLPISFTQGLELYL